MALNFNRARIAQNLRGSGRRAREAFGEARQQVLSPSWIAPHLDRATRLGQWLAAALLIVVVPVTLILIKTAHTMMINILGMFYASSTSAPWVVTFIALAMVVVAGWFWIQFVRSAGFGLTLVGESE